VIDRVKVALDVGVNYPPTPQEHFVNCADCLRSTALWPKPIRVAHGSRRATTKDENELEMS
jgi:hypothetical protein